MYKKLLILLLTLTVISTGCGTATYTEGDVEDLQYDMIVNMQSEVDELESAMSDLEMGFSDLSGSTDQLRDESLYWEDRVSDAEHYTYELEYCITELRGKIDSLQETLDEY